MAALFYACLGESEAPPGQGNTGGERNAGGGVLGKGGSGGASNGDAGGGAGGASSGGSDEHGGTAGAPSGGSAGTASGRGGRGGEAAEGGAGAGFGGAHCDFDIVCETPGERYPFRDYGGDYGDLRCEADNRCSVCLGFGPTNCQDVVYWGEIHEAICCANQWFLLYSTDHYYPEQTCSRRASPLPLACASSGEPTPPSNRALRFDGVASRLRASVGIPRGTVDLWFKSAAESGALLADMSNAAYLAGGRLCVLRPGFQSANEYCSTRADFADGQWHHAAFVGPTMYIDGERATWSTRSGAWTPQLSEGLVVGHGPVAHDGTHGYFAGELDEIRLWSVELTAREVRFLHRRELPAEAFQTYEGLEHFWSLEAEEGITIAEDLGPLGQHATLEGFPSSASPWVSPGAP